MGTQINELYLGPSQATCGASYHSHLLAARQLIRPEKARAIQSDTASQDCNSQHHTLKPDCGFCAQDLAGKISGAANDAAGQAKGAASDAAGSAKGAASEAKGKAQSVAKNSSLNTITMLDLPSPQVGMRLPNSAHICHIFSMSVRLCLWFSTAQDLIAQSTTFAVRAGCHRVGFSWLPSCCGYHAYTAHASWSLSSPGSMHGVVQLCSRTMHPEVQAKAQPCSMIPDAHQATPFAHLDPDSRHSARAVSVDSDQFSLLLTIHNVVADSAWGLVLQMADRAKAVHASVPMKHIVTSGQGLQIQAGVPFVRR